ncbi:rhodanese-like domain-containing protein [Gaetbulibacter aestuarii]|uniref:Rhodanese-like domain-containing protein n=1 Tax=Gaetbulibacter aestuarii TaxID=1502358 RepID=A0ABW7MYC7_9FLAO
MSRIFSVVFSLMLSISLLSCKDATAQEGAKNLSPEAFSKAITGNSVLLIDVRTPEEFQSGHIPKAQNINFFDDDFQSSLSRLDTTQAVYIYCRSGHRSGQSVANFKKAGFSKIYNLDGGILNWESKDFKTTSP